MSEPEKTVVNPPPGNVPPANAPPASGDGYAVASLVLGILSCLFFWLMPLCLAFAALSIFLGRAAQRRFSVLQPGQPSARAWAKGGIYCSLAGVIICVASLGSCFLAAHYLAADGKKEYGKAIQELERDPDFEKSVKELHEELDKLDDGSTGGSQNEAASGGANMGTTTSGSTSAGASGGSQKGSDKNDK